jgi:hypothetical protein
VLIAKLSCKSCCPNPPLATLLDLECPTAYPGMTLADFPFDPVRIECARCDRRGQYNKARLIARYGPNIVGPDVLRQIVDCKREKAMNDPCGAHFTDLA